jgi:hypothetical protein
MEQRVIRRGNEPAPPVHAQRIDRCGGAIDVRIPLERFLWRGAIP